MAGWLATDSSTSSKIMNSRFILSLSLLFFFSIFIRSVRTGTAPEYIFHVCPNATLFMLNSTYQSNLHNLLSSLSSAAAHSSTGFANATTGEKPPGRTSGLFLCRGDLDTTACSHCVATGKQGILERCPNRRVSAIWYDQCMLWYSNQSIFSTMDGSPNLIFHDSGNVSDPTRFMQLLGETLKGMARRASAGRSGKKVAVAEANFTVSHKLYALAQCTPDLAASDCLRCLQIGIANLPEAKQGGRFLASSCNWRYELYPFYNASALWSSTPPRAPARPPPSPMTEPEGKSNEAAVIIFVVALSVSGTVVVILLLVCRFCRNNGNSTVVHGDHSGLIEMIDAKSLQFHFDTIQAATNNFSNQNKLGRGGFGEVFQGMLPNGIAIAVKRLSQGSYQGVQEFVNEVITLVGLQHRNLVQLLGFCLAGDEKLLIYEFVPNKSLDYFLLDLEKHKQLDWSTRFKIACGVAQGMFYLHEESRLRIIHRDIKPSNILLDQKMNPKISDFGTARIFGVDQTRANTKNCVGTFGYMALEYAMGGDISTKSDVYSFGILLLELTSGEKNSSFHQVHGVKCLAFYVWEKWRDGMLLTALDRTIKNRYPEDEVLRCLKIGTLCAQVDPNRRPTMKEIVLCLNGKHVPFELPPESAMLPNMTERPRQNLEPNQSSWSSVKTQYHSLAGSDFCQDTITCCA